MIKKYLSWLAIGAAGFAALLAITGSAQATSMTYGEWDALSQDERETYISGVLNSISDAPTGMHYYRCVRGKKMMDSQLADGVRAAMTNEPGAQTLPVQAALLYYLNQLCSLPAGK